ncbi:MAG: HAD-IIIA family hydrolase, partial [Solirubrobacterales bacterium]|nr:HAD-IIIA family hydrolase [Solirubrobacterales bacterium]
EIHRRMLEAVRGAGGRIDAIYHCPHEVGCACRKPELGMFRAAAEDFGLPLAETALVGDSPSDMLAATRVGALRVLIAASGSGPGQDAEADYVARDLNQAARWLLAIPE